VAEIEKLMGVSAADIEKVMGVGSGDIEKVMGVELVTSTSYMGNRGVAMGGYTGSYARIVQIDYKAITSSGDTADFGDTTVGGRFGSVVVGNDSRACTMGGDRVIWTGSGFTGGNVLTNYIGYITIASTGNTGDFGDFLTNRYYNYSGVGNGIRGMCCGGFDPYGNINNITYITVASTGNAADAGDCTVAMSETAGNANTTRGIWWVSRTASYFQQKNADYVAIATTNNAADFGDYSVLIRTPAAIGLSESRNVWAGGRSEDSSGAYITNIEYVNPSTTMDTEEFGDLAAGASHMGGGKLGNGTRGEIWGGELNSSGLNSEVIQYITIANTGDSTDAGNLDVVRSHWDGWSGD